ncbi:hypothetical protein [Blastopirellula marina]|uniref:Secreted protein n=1 Tax=Blastopirellula marina DSM 3645 TaxID=314230 RepID=A3ZQ79_9BACT|nr:hypothetical protein [Blastopirellula marina]EAQ81352.1 hypothetical protein DSM3645_23211 [Blastopirellula marina DSM 3645]
MRYSHAKTSALGALLLSCLLAVGCFSDPSGLRTYQCSGIVTFNGEPVELGYINFEPNTTAGNSGPGASARITQGRYKTEEGKGVVGGPYRVVIVGYDGKSPDGLGDGSPLFPEFVIERDLPRDDSDQDFEIPRGDRK